MQVHPVANVFPMMSDAEIDDLARDILENGQREPVWMYQGQVIDGRNRIAACERIGRLPNTREFVGTEDELLPFVISLNLKRRHLSESQRAMVAANIANMNEGRPAETAQICAVSQQEAADMLNVSRRTVQAAAKVRDEGTPELVQAVQAGKVSVSAAADVAELPKQEQAVVVARGEAEILAVAKEIRAKKAEERRAERVAKIVEISSGNAPLDTARKFPVIYCDPPWRYEHIETESRAIENQYPTMALDEICSLPVSEIAMDDCVLFMWTTSPKLAEAFDVLRAWGFDYRTCAVWDKEVIGMGYYFRQQHELLLVATKGSPITPLPSNRPASVIRSRREEHSKKPALFYELIEQMYGELPRVELFCRSPREGWAAWGNQSQEAA